LERGVDSGESANRFAKTESLAALELLVRDKFGYDLILPLREQA